MAKGICINDTIHGLIKLTEYEKRIVSTVGFNRLHDVYQNSTVYMTFPTNRTKRFEHSIGTMKICSDMFFYSVQNSESKVIDDVYKIFLEKIKEIADNLENSNEYLIENKLKSMTIKFSDLKNFSFDFFSFIIPSNVKEEYHLVYYLLIEAIRTAALLHDIGHPPYSHVVENAIKSSYLSYRDKENTNERTKEYLKILDKYFENGSGQLHEEMGIEISKSILEEIIPDCKEGDQKQAKQNFLEIILLNIVIKIFKDEDGFKCLHKIISGNLDGDRLDYVCRDGVSSGLNNGLIDYNRIISNMKMFASESNDVSFCLPIKSVNSVEDFLQRRFIEYKSVINHHRVIKTDFLLKNITENLINEYLDCDKNCENETEYLIPYDISGLWYLLEFQTQTKKRNALSQWNDSWLITVLKQEFYKNYYIDNNLSERARLLRLQLFELLRNEKKYYSLIKRCEDFRIVDQSVKKELCDSKSEITAQINKIQKNIINNGLKKDRVTPAGLIRAINEILVVAKEKTQFVLSNVYKASNEKQVFNGADELLQKIEDIVKNVINDKFSFLGKCNTIFVSRKLKTGLDNKGETVLFYDNQNTIYDLMEISGIREVLENEIDFVPLFSVYVLIIQVNSSDNQINNNAIKILENIGREIGMAIKDKILEVLNDVIGCN